MSEETPRPARRAGVAAVLPPSAPPKEPPPAERPIVLDFYPREGEKETRLARFYERLRDGRLSTTRCPRDELLLWPPRTACPKCHSEELVWVDLPSEGRLYAFSAVLVGAPLGMEADVPFAVGLVDLDGTELRLFGRIVGKAWNALAVGETVDVESYDAPDGRVFYRFRARP